MLDPLFEFIAESSVALVDVEVVFLEEIVGDVYIGPAVLIHIADGDAQSETDDASIDTGFFADIVEFPIVVSIEMIAAAFEKIGYRCLFGGDLSGVGVVERVNGERTVVDDKAIEISIEVIIEEGGMGGVSVVVESVFSRFFGEGEIVVVEEELIATLSRVQHMTGVAEVDIEPSVLIEVDKYDAGGPLFFSAEAGFIGNVFKLKISFVPKKLIGTLIRREEYFWESVVVEVAGGDTASVVKVSVFEYVEVFGLFQVIGEFDTAVVDLGEQGVFGSFRATG